jgi:hypothetical protein
MYEPQTILSSNTKTGCSINLPIAGHCIPTKTCASTCYAKRGHISFPTSTRKQRWVSEYLAAGNLFKLIHECLSRTAIRISGSGDLNQEHVKNVIKLAKACPDTMFWGMTRKVDIARKINNKLPNLKLLLSVDRDSPKATWKYKEAMCWGPRMIGDKVPNDERIITVFPYHFSGKVIKNMPHHKKDCPAVWDHRGCMVCGKCWKW